MFSPPWVVWKINSEELEGIVKRHFKSGFRWLSKLQFGNKFFTRLKLCDPNFVCLDVAEDCFHMVQVTNLPKKIFTIKGHQITVRATESRYVDNLMLDQTDLDINVTMFEDLALFMEKNLKPNDIIIIWGGRLVYRKSKRIVETNVFASTPANLVIFRPLMNTNSSNITFENIMFLDRMNDHHNIQYDKFTCSSMQLLKIFPKTVDTDENIYEWTELRPANPKFEYDVLEDFVPDTDSENECCIVDVEQNRIDSEMSQSDVPEGSTNGGLEDEADSSHQDSSSGFNLDISFDSIHSNEEIATPEFVNKTVIKEHNYRRKRNENVNINSFSDYQEKCAKYK